MSRHEIESEVAGNIWKVEVAAGDVAGVDDVLLIIESMKMEIPVESPVAGRVMEVLVAPEDAVTEGQLLVVLEN